MIQSRLLVPESVGRGVAGAAAVVGESSLGVGLDFIVVGWTERYECVAETCFEKRGYLLRIACGISGDARRERNARHFSPVAVARVTCAPGAHPYRFARRSHVDGSKASSVSVGVLPRA